MKRRSVLVGGLMGACASQVWAAPASLRPVTVVVQGLHRVGMLPLLLAHKLGFFQAEGLDVQFQAVPSHVRSLTELAALPAAVFAGTFERTLYLNAHGQAQQAFALLSRSPQIVLGLPARQYPSAASLRDMVGGRVGIDASGSMGHRMAQLMLLRAGLKITDVQFVEEPDPDLALIAFLRGELDALSHTDPLISRLERMGSLRVMVDTRSLKVCDELFGGPMACTCLSAARDWLDRSSDVAQGLSHAVVRALKWLQTAGPSDLVRHLPEASTGGDVGLFLAGFVRSRETLSIDGLFPQYSARNVVRVMHRLQLPLDLGVIEPDATWTNRFVARSKVRFRV